MEIVSSSDLSHTSKVVEPTQKVSQNSFRGMKPTAEVESVFLDRSPTGKHPTPVVKERVQKAVSREELITRTKNIFDALREVWTTFVKNLKTKKEPLVLSMDSNIKTRWDLFIMLLATYNCYQIPLDIAFEPALFNTTAFRIINGIIDFLFFIDICISFRTTYLDERTGFEVRKPKLLAINYLKGQFTIDVLATIPFDSFAELILGKAGFFKAFGVLKLVRVLRLSRIITYLRSKEEVKALLKLVKLIFYLMLYLHCFACVWWLVVKEKKTWISTLFFSDGSKWYFTYKASTVTQYAICLHASIVLATGNDCGPKDRSQLLVTTAGIFLGAIINANIFGELAVLITSLQTKDNDYQQKMTQVNTTIANLKLPLDLTDRIRDFVIAN